MQEAGAIYHVMSRGHLKQEIFREEKDKAYFLELLKRGVDKYNIHIFAYCLMKNHYHMSLRIQSTNLSEFMHFLGSSYANYKVKSGWVGHVFAGRYKSIRVEEEEYFLIVNRYIQLNPVEAGLVDKPEEYAWSNYGRCVGGGNAGWLEEDWLAEYFGPGLDAARMRYKRFVKAAMGEGSYYPENKVVAQALLGGEDFIKRIKAGIREGEWAREVAGNKVLSRTISLDEVHRAVCGHLGFEGLEGGIIAATRSTVTLAGFSSTWPGDIRRRRARISPGKWEGSRATPFLTAIARCGRSLGRMGVYGPGWRRTGYAYLEG